MKYTFLLVFCFLILSVYGQKQYRIDSLGFDGKPYDAGLYKDISAILSNSATRKGAFGVVEYGKFLQYFSFSGKAKSKLVEKDSLGKTFQETEGNYYGYSDGKYLFINHEQQLCRACVIGTYIVFIQNAIGDYGILINPKKEIFWMLDTRTGMKSWLFSKKGLPLLLKQFPDLQKEYKNEKLPSLDYVAMIEKDLKYMRLINERIKK